jgi:hypothetical protein
MKILLRQKSGLGNQLFQYAAAMYFAERYAAELEILQEPQELAVSHGHPRPFLLSKFSITAPVRQRNRWDRLLCSTAAHKQPLANLARHITGTETYKPHFETDWSFLPTLPVSSKTRAIYLDGYFQVYTYAETIEQQLRKELILHDAPAGRNAEVVDQIRSCESPVSVHVRRGDYTTIYGGRDALPMTYYENSIRRIRQLTPSPVFFVFSDDVAFCREHLPAGEDYIFIDHNAQRDAHEDLRLMSSCRHHIIANSSFSWWGAWLNPNPDKFVLAPDRWLDPTVPCPDLIPPRWQRIATGTLVVSTENKSSADRLTRT